MGLFLPSNSTRHHQGFRMLKGLKILAWLAGIVLLVIVAASIALPLFFNPNDFKPQIAQLVREKTGRELTLPGNITLSVFPWLGVKTGALALGNAPGFGKQPFVGAEAAEVRVKLLPLLRKEVRLDTVSLRGLVLNLSRDKSGKTNWADLISKNEKTEAKNPLANLAALAIGGVDISDATVVWDDKTSGAHYALDKINLRTGALADNTPFDIALEFALASKQPALSAQISAKGKGKLEIAQQHYQLQGVLLKTVVHGKNTDDKSALNLSARLNMEWPQQTLTLSDVKLSGLGVTASGSFKGSQIFDAPSFSGNVKVTGLSPRAVMPLFGIKPPVTADPAALTRAALETQVAASAQMLRLSNLRLRLDDTTATGSLSVSNLSNPQPVLALALDRLDIDRYLPPALSAAQEGKKSAATPASAAAAAASALPVEFLRKLNLDTTLRITALKVKNLRLADALVVLVAHSGDIALKPLSANLYQGKYSGGARLDVRGKVPQLALDESLSGVQIGPLLKDLYGKDRLEGRATLSAKLTARGTTPEALKRTLSGNAAFSFTDGAVKGVNIARLLREAQARLKGVAAAPDSAPHQTDFSELTGTLTLANGVARNDDLAAKSPLLRVTGKGQADLVREQMDYLISVAVVGTLEGQGGGALTELKGLTIPVRVSGPFSDLSYRPDVNAMISDTAKAKVQQKLEEKKQELRDRLQEKLKDLFNR
ncbi:MAG: AsmA family protein [Proteobacteria bacterium]|nr:AsmA family protein [Pseudomonadota bacterium]